MRTKDVLEGLQILQKYRNDQDGFDLGAEHDVLYAYSTDKPVEGKDLDRMIELGWTQPETEYHKTDEDFAVKHYNPEESWSCFV